jgi:hypothetical protein
LCLQGTITDNIAFLQHMLLFRDWTKMRTLAVDMLGTRVDYWRRL